MLPITKKAICFCLTALSLSLSMSLFVTNSLRADDSRQQAFDQALSLYDGGKFKEAAQGYEGLLASGRRNGDILYNLSLSYYRVGDYGRAMASMLAARNLLPRDPDIRSNVKFYEGKIQDKLTAQPVETTGDRLLNFWVGGLSLKEVLTTNLVVCIIAALCLSLGVLVPVLKPYRYRMLWILALPALTLLLSWSKLSLDKTWGAVVADGTKVYSGPGEASTLLFNLNAGAPVEVASGENTGFRRITLSDGKKGWVAAKDLAVF